jgi:hypothetical protein
MDLGWLMKYLAMVRRVYHFEPAGGRMSMHGGRQAGSECWNAWRL